MSLDNLIDLKLVEESKSIHYGHRYRYEAVTKDRFYEYVFRHSFNGSAHLTVTEMNRGIVENSDSGIATVKNENDAMQEFILNNLRNKQGTGGKE